MFRCVPSREGHRGLLERLIAGQREGGDISASILAHLQALLATRAGALPLHADYGLPDLTDALLQVPENGLATVEAAIEATIRHHEPRLTHVFVRCIGLRPGSILAFEIEGRLASDPRRSVRCHTLLGPAGEVQISSS